jgi:hypothetical protein
LWQFAQVSLSASDISESLSPSRVAATAFSLSVKAIRSYTYFWKSAF